MYKSKFSFIILFLLLGLLSCKSDKQSDSEDTSGDQSIETPTSSYSNFIKISAEDSQLIFENTITHDLATKFNLFDYDYFYNGSGVGIEDINNDGLMDIFFCGNQVENKLFLNKGNLVFEDITTTANINTNKFWSSGVTFVDINSDGWADIYISQGGPYDKDNRKNLLFINQKDNSFVESAED
ncbi:MAG: VCBS repeat-containing protein, partial [Bacteroidia bacterium]|nr:VCBS repeat-containing protein [Bacteroidia bacterium]